MTAPRESTGPGGRSQFSDIFNAALPSDREGNSIFSGLDVLSGLVDGIDDFVAGSQPRWQHPDSAGAVLLGSSFGLNDPALLRAMEQLSGACVVISKPKRTDYFVSMHRKLARLNDQQRPPGIPVQAFDEPRDLAPLRGGRPLVVGPYTPEPGPIPAYRTLGFRPASDRDFVPLVHAKLALLGHLLQWEVDAPGYVEALEFQPVRLWSSSANFTAGSRRSIEHGSWTEDPAQIAAAQRLLLKLIAASEPVETNVDRWDPELAPIEYDHDAMVEALPDPLDDDW